MVGLGIPIKCEQYLFLFLLIHLLPLLPVLTPMASTNRKRETHFPITNAAAITAPTAGHVRLWKNQFEKFDYFSTISCYYVQNKYVHLHNECIIIKYKGSLNVFTNHNARRVFFYFLRSSSKSGKCLNYEIVALSL